MFDNYFRKGRHRQASYAGMKMAALTAAVALPTLALTGTAQADTGPDWDPIIHCESGGSPTAKNPSSTASGLFQFINGTWAAYGGLEFAPTAKQASPDEQHIVANRAYAKEGYGPWAASKSCWQGKMGTGFSAPVKVAPKKSAPSVAAEPKPMTRTKVVEAPKVQPVGGPTLGTDGVYEVKPGDTLTNIAIVNNVAGGWQAVFEKNTDVVEHPDWIWPGEKLDLN